MQDTKRFTPDRVNVGETGQITVPNRSSRISRGKKQVGSLSSAGRGQFVTVEMCMSAAGSFTPPLFIFPRKRMKDELMDRSPHVNRNRARYRMDAILHLCGVVRTLPETCKPFRSKTRSFDPRWPQNAHQHPAFHLNSSSQFCDSHLPTTAL